MTASGSDLTRGRSSLFSEKIGHAEYLEFDSIKYKVQNSSVDFCQEERIVYGGQAREMLLLDFHSWSLLDFYKECLRDLITGEQDTQTEFSTEEPLPAEQVPTLKTIPELMQYIVRYLNWYFVNDVKKENAVTDKDIMNLVESYNKRKARNHMISESYVPIEFFAQQEGADGRIRGVGVCRHQALLAVFLIVMLMRHVQKFTPDEVGAIKFQAYLISADIKKISKENKESHFAHAVAVCKMDAMIYILDPRNKIMIQVEHGKVIPESEKAFETASNLDYKKFIENIVKRYYEKKDMQKSEHKIEHKAS